ncbi:MAG: hypothetical protein ACOX21_00600 [Bacillota bacterium]|nr:hypothetical protein [Bacillota bacterium]HOC06944.1 hypothetical protein [Bacillota bacterium]HPZ22594.1 hypothetical protein [Bacillota bacterium]HQD20385.1 hypothetical protein [Bacillota bacterium]
MKKIAVLLLLVTLVLATAACGGSRTPLTAPQFVSKMEAAGFIVVDAADQFPEGVVEAVYLAVGENYQIEFYVVPSVDQAKRAFEENKSDFEALSGGATKYASVNNYSYYTKTTSDGYYVVSRTDNTFIYVSADAQYKKEISGIIEDLGY